MSQIYKLLIGILSSKDYTILSKNTVAEGTTTALAINRSNRLPLEELLEVVHPFFNF
jgi:hypothetical protein